jgi:SAM-dependent methyltransferase
VRINLNTIIAKQLRKPSGFLGFITGKLLAKQNIFAYEAIEKYNDFSKNNYVFEIGYGPGAGIQYLVEKYQLKVDGVDFSKGMYKAASKRNRAHIKNNIVNIVYDDFLNINLQKDKYDCVYFSNVTYFWKDLYEPFRKILYTIKDDGKLVFYMTNKSFLDKYPVTKTDIFNKYSFTEVKNVLINLGFKNVNHHQVIDKNDDFLIVEATK